MRGRARRDAAAEMGQAIVELALLLPILVFGMIGAADVARALAVQLAVENSARAAAESEVMSSSPSQSAAQTAARSELGQTPGVAPASATVTETLADGSGHACTTSTLSAPCFVTVSVRYTFTTLVHWPGVSNTFTFDRSTRLRRYL
ncbi:MAG: pilus assembly protein [Chloroflexota bacterium]|nr:pilus assembly protein [Chloroflexota bacterium]